MIWIITKNISAIKASSIIKTNRKEVAANIRAKINEAITELHNKYKKWNFKIQIDVDSV